MSLKSWLAEKLAGKDPVDEKVKKKAEMAKTIFNLTSEDIKKEKTKVRRRETDRKKKRKKTITDVNEAAEKVQDSIGSSKKEKALTPEERDKKFRRLGWA